MLALVTEKMKWVVVVSEDHRKGIWWICDRKGSCRRDLKMLLMKLDWKAEKCRRPGRVLGVP